MSVYKIIIGKDMAPQNKNNSQCKSVRGKKKKLHLQEAIGTTTKKKLNRKFLK